MWRTSSTVVRRPPSWRGARRSPSARGPDEAQWAARELSRLTDAQGATPSGPAMTRLTSPCGSSGGSKERLPTVWRCASIVARKKIDDVKHLYAAAPS